MLRMPVALAALEVGDQHIGRRNGHLEDGLPHGGKAWPGDPGNLGVVEPGNRQIIGDRQPQFARRKHHANRHLVILHQYSRWPISVLQHAPPGGMAAIEGKQPGLDPCVAHRATSLLERALIALETGVGGGMARVALDDPDASMPQCQDMRRDHMGPNHVIEQGRGSQLELAGWRDPGVADSGGVELRENIRMVRRGRCKHHPVENAVFAPATLPPFCWSMRGVERRSETQTMPISTCP